MNSFRLATFLSIFVVALVTQIAMADETVSEKIGATANDAKRGMKKTGHRIQEAVCAEGDAKCAAEKIKNRAIEVKDATVDGVKKVKNKVD